MDVDGVDFGSHGIIYVTQEKEKPSVTEWSNPATELLLKILRKHYQMHATDGKFGSKRVLYENCSISMKKKGYRYEPSQCENKWKSLKRRYLTSYRRAFTAKGKRKGPHKKQLFDDEIEFILQFVQPEFKREPEEYTSNTPGDFDEEMEQDAENQEENNESDGDQKYTPDEQLVQRMLKGSDDEDQKDNVFVVASPQPKAAAAESSTAGNLVLSALRDLTKAVKSNVQSNTNIFRSQSASFEQIMVCLDSMDRKEDKRIEIERKNLEQRKIQNTLLAKIVQRLGSSGNN